MLLLLHSDNCYKVGIIGSFNCWCQNSYLQEMKTGALATKISTSLALDSFCSSNTQI